MIRKHIDSRDSKQDTYVIVGKSAKTLLVASEVGDICLELKYGN